MIKTIGRAAVVLLVGLFPFWGAQRTHAAPAAANLTPAEVQSNGTYTVAISNPKIANGAIDKLALQAVVQGGKPARQVRFTVLKDDNDVYSRTDNGAPFCLLGESNNACITRQAGDRWNVGQPRMSVGDYAVQIEVYSNPSNEPDWSGTANFKLVGGRPVADQPGYGTGSGNGPLAEVDDFFYTDQGMQKIKVQAKVFTRNGQPMKQGDVQHVWFRIQRTADFETVYSNIELSPPYCIFGEEADGKTCRTLRVGEEWPQSNRFQEDGNGNRTGQKENDPDIQRTQIEAGEYELSIQIRTNQGSWDSSGTFVLLP